MTKSISANSAIVGVYDIGWDQENNVLIYEPIPENLIKAVTATSTDGLNWITTLQAEGYHLTSSYIITITFNIDNEDITYITSYIFDGK